GQGPSDDRRRQEGCTGYGHVNEQILHVSLIKTSGVIYKVIKFKTGTSPVEESAKGARIPEFFSMILIIQYQVAKSTLAGIYALQVFKPEQHSPIALILF
ncbi:MAG: hypothetical protein WCQ99_16950, partial [Pseudomonadota bacterium]